MHPVRKGWCEGDGMERNGHILILCDTINQWNAYYSGNSSIHMIYYIMMLLIYCISISL